MQINVVNLVIVIFLSHFEMLKQELNVHRFLHSDVLLCS